MYVLFIEQVLVIVATSGILLLSLVSRIIFVLCEYYRVLLLFNNYYCSVSSLIIVSYKLTVVHVSPMHTSGLTQHCLVSSTTSCCLNVMYLRRPTKTYNFSLNGKDATLGFYKPFTGSQGMWPGVMAVHALAS